MTTPQYPFPTPTNEELAQVAYDKTLERVAEILETVKATLNVQGSTCNGCGHERREEWEQYQAAEQLGGAITRITKASSLIKFSVGALPTPPRA